MTKNDLIDAIAGLSGQTKTDTTAFLNSFTEVVSYNLAKGGDVTLYGLGSFDVLDIPARKGRNPATGAPIDIAASRKVRFKAAKPLKDAIAA